MKKTVIIVLSIIVCIFVVIFCVNFLATNKSDQDLDRIKKTFIINNENIDDVTNIYVYNGDDTYYIIEYISNNEKYISVLDDKEKHYIDVKYDELKDIDEIKNNKYTIGYKYDKLIYEVKTSSKDGFTYSYYDALNGEFIKKIELDK